MLLFLPVMLFQLAAAQTISFRAEKGSPLAIFLNGIECTYDKTAPVILNYTKEQPITFDFKGIKSNYAYLSFKYYDINTRASEVVIDSTLYAMTSSVNTTADKLLSVGGKQLSLNKTFRVDMLLRNDPARKIVSVIFVPQLQQEATGSASAAGQLMAATKAVAAEETPYQPGSAVLDAIKLADNRNLTKDQVKQIAKVYFPNEDMDDYAKAKQKLDAISFLAEKDRLKAEKARLATEAQSGGELFSMLSASGISGMVTTLADGLAKFYVKRVKEELAINFFDRMKQEIGNRPALYLLFPQTTGVLNVASTEIYEYQRYIQNIQSAVKNDLVAIPENFPAVVDHYDASYFCKHAYTRATLLSACYITSEIKKQAHFGDILAGYPLNYLDGLENKVQNLKPSLQFLQALSGSLRDTAKGTEAPYWVSIGSVRQLVKSKRAFKIYLGLLSAQIRNEYGSIVFSGDMDLAKQLDAINQQVDTTLETFNLYRNFILQLGVKTDVLNKMISYGTKANTDSLAIEQVAAYVNATVDLLKYISNIQRLSLFKDQPKESYAAYFEMANTITDIITDVNRKNYAGIVNKAIRAYELLEEPADSTERILLGTDVKNKLLKYGGMMAALGMARNSDEVAQVIETAALPVGSARIKRNARFNVSLNGYVGLFAGGEKINDDASVMRFTSGLTAPLGIGFNWGHKLFFFNTRTEWSTSVYASLIDIGAFTAFRFGDSLSQAPAIKLKNILSPGLFLSIGIPKWPLSVNLGTQLGPNLRTVTATSGTAAGDFSSKTYFRHSISICVDIPLLNLYTKTSK